MTISKGCHLKAGQPRWLERWWFEPEVAGASHGTDKILFRDGAEATGRFSLGSCTLFLLYHAFVFTALS